MPFIIISVSHNIKYLKINLIKIFILYYGNLKNLNKWGDIIFSDRKMLKMCQFFPKLIYKVNTIPIKISTQILLEHKIILKFIWNSK